MTNAVVLSAPDGRPHLAWPARQDPDGRTGPTKGRAGGPYWRRTSHGLYLPASVEQTVEQRIVEAAAVLPPHGAVTGWAALHWAGARRWFEGFTAGGELRPVDLVTAGEDIRPQSGIAVSAERLDPRDVIVVDGVRVTTPARSAWFEMRYSADERAAARVASMTAYHDLVSVAELTEFTLARPAWTGAPRCRGGLALAEENCWSPPELDVALIWRLDAGLPRALCNQPVFDREGHHIGTPDLLDPEAGMVVEYEGTLHLAGARRRRDVLKEERYRRVGLEYLTMLGADRHDPAEAAARLCEVRSRARFAAESTRPWTVEHPPDWPSTTTVSLRRALDLGDRTWLLQYRTAA